MAHPENPHPPRRRNPKLKTYWDLDSLVQGPLELKTSLAPVFAYLEQKFADWDYPVSKDDYCFRLDEEKDRLYLWVEQDLLDTSPFPLEIEPSSLVEGTSPKGLGEAFRLWIPLIQEAKKKIGAPNQFDSP